MREFRRLALATALSYSKADGGRSEGEGSDAVALQSDDDQLNADLLAFIKG